MKEPLLSVIEQHSAAWKKVELYLNERLAKLREENDALTLNAEQTAAKRGRIGEIKALLKINEQDQIIQEPEFKD